MAMSTYSAAPAQSTTTSYGATSTTSSTGDGLKRALSTTEGFEAQQALLSPNKVDDAITYNTKHNGKASYIKSLQSFLGVLDSGRYDSPTVSAVAEIQDGEDLVVDGKIGQHTRGALEAGGFDDSAPQKPLSVEPEVRPQLDEPTAEPTTTPTEVEPVSPRPVSVEPLSPGSAPPLHFGDGTHLSVTAFSAWVEQDTARVELLLAELETHEPSSPDAARVHALMHAGHASLVVAGETLRDRAVGLINDASLLRSPETQPTFPDRAELTALGASLRRLSRAGGGMAEAAAICQDAVLAIQQGASVLSARATWAERPMEAKGNEEAAAQKKAKDDPLNAVFKDSGFSSRISTYQNSKGQARVTDWCGMFVSASLFRGGGLDEELRKGLLHTKNVLDYFRYEQRANATRAPRSIWADHRWHDLKSYHAERNSPRRWQDRDAIASAMASGGALDIRPGDVVLIDHSGHSGKGSKPNHITMVESYDAKTHQLTTIEGNTKGIQANADGVAPELGDGHHAKGQQSRSSVGLHTRDMTDMGKAARETHADQHAANEAHAKDAPKGAYQGKSGMTVFGVGRPSAVDFEEHQYATKTIPEALASISPADMTATSKDKVGVNKAS